MAQTATRVPARPTAGDSSAPRPARTPRPSRAAAAATAETIERETRLVREAIAMVALGASTRVVVAGIRHGEDILDSARRMALESGVRVNPIWRRDQTGADISVEPIRE